MYIHHICIQTNKYNQSLGFYKEILGFEIVQETKGFNNREYNTWLNLNGFMIELQTGKNSENLENNNFNSEGIVHFCLYTDNFNLIFNKINRLNKSLFKTKNGNKIYNVGDNRLFKLKAPEGTIIEIRDSRSI